MLGPWPEELINETRETTEAGEEDGDKLNWDLSEVASLLWSIFPADF